MNPNKNLTKNLSTLAIYGNICMTLWILYNGVSEDFQGTQVEIASYLALIGSLLLNMALLGFWRRSLAA